MSNTVKFTITLPDHETELCPECRSTDMFESASEVPELYCKNEWHLNELVIELPAVWTICNRCKGNGTHMNPNIDGHGITAEEWERDWDDDSREMYKNGGYDVPCVAGCKGGKVLVPDEEACKKEPLKTQLARYEKEQDRIAQEAAEDRRTSYMESGGAEGSWY